MSNLATIVNNILADSGIDDINVVVTTGSYNNPAFITALAWTKITGTPTTLGGYGITDAYTQTQVNNLLAAKQNNITLTTTGTSGAATLIGATLNIPQYQGVLTNPVTGTGIAGQVAYWSSASAITGESAFLWDATNNRLGIGVTPTQALDVVGKIKATDDLVLAQQNPAITFDNGTSGTLRIFSTFAAAAIATFNSTGVFRLNQYGTGARTGTRAFDLAVDASGNVIEVAVGAGTITGGGTAGQVAYFDGSSSISSESSFTYNSSTNLLSVNGIIESYSRFRLYFNDIQTLTAELYEDGASTNGGTLALYSKASGTISTIISAAPTKLNFINNAANFMVGYNFDVGYKLGVNGSTYTNGDFYAALDGRFDGKVGIGGAPESGISLYIKGSGVDSPLLKMQGFANTTAMLGDTTTGTTDVGVLWLYNDGTLRARLSSSTGEESFINAGNFVIGSNTGSGYKVEIFHSNEDALRIHNTTTTGDALIAFTNADAGFLARIQGLDGGGLQFDVGNGAGGLISNALRIANTGQATFISHVNSGGWFAAPNDYGLTALNAAGTAGRVLIKLNSSNQIEIGRDSDISAIRLGTASALGAVTIASNGSVEFLNRISLGGVGDQTYASLFLGGATTSGTNQWAIITDPQLSGTGDNYAVFANARIKANTAVNNTFGVYIPSAERLSGATIVNNYALYIANQTSGSSLNYSIYSSGGTNYFGGRVGIGVVIPGAQLHVNSSDTLVANFNCTSNGTYLRWQNNGTSFGDIGSGASLVSGGSTNDFTIHARSTYNIVFALDFATKMLLNSSGNLSINNTNNTYRLDVTGNVRALTASSGVSPRTDLGATIIAEGNTRAGLYILTSGTAAGSYGSIWWGNGNINTDAFILVENNTRAMRFGTADGTRMSILSNGRVGIGTPNPEATLQVNGGFRIYTTNDDSNELRAIFSPGGAADAFSVSMYKGDAATIGIRLAADGTTYFNGTNVLVGTTSDIGTAFRVVGGATGIDFETNNNSTFATSILYTIRETGVSRTITTGGYSFGPSNPLTMILTQNSNTPLGMFYAADNADGAGLKGYKSRGTVAAPVSVNNGDTIFSMEGWAFHGSGPNHAKFGAGMRFVKDDAFGTANAFAPQRTEFYNANSVTTTITTFTILPNANCTAGGSMTATSFFESSDSRIKTLLDNNVDYSLIANVAARYYEKNEVEELGYFAQDFEQILPSAVYKDEKGLLNLSYTQVHTAKIAALEKEVRELKEQLKNK